MSSLIISILTMGVIAAFFAYGLSIAQKKFKVKEDPRIDAVEEALPGANCEGCGFPGCRAMAEVYSSWGIVNLMVALLGGRKQQMQLGKYLVLR